MIEKSMMSIEILERILNTSRRMAETRSLSPLLEYAMDEAISLSGAERGYLVMTNPDASFEYRVKRQGTGDLLQTEDQISTSILGDVIRSGQPLILRDAIGDSKFKEARSVAHFKLRSVMCVPLISHVKVIGAIYVENRSISGRFNENALPPLILLANQATVAIENAALNDNLEERIIERTRELADAKVSAEQSWTEAVEANRLRTMLLGNVAHDLRVPLTVVVGALSMLNEGDMGPLNDEQHQWIENALNAANHILSLIDDVFDLTKLEMGSLALYRQPTDLKEFLTSIYHVGQGLPWPKSVKLELNLPPTLPTLYIDPHRIRQVLLNLFSNALKFTANGTVTLYAEVMDDQNQVLIGVADTGEGIAPDNLGRLFNRFQQFDTNISRRRLGTGLGLAISRELVEMHGGQIMAESVLGAGTTFKMVLPIKEG